jgi:hypothetical protein
MTGLLLAVALLAADDPQTPRVRSEVRVERILLDAWATRADGEPLVGLSPADFRITIGGLPAEVEAVEWIPADVAESALDPGGPPGPALVPPAPGRLLVVFVQGDTGRHRTIGAMHAGHHLDPFLGSLLPTDRVAVVSYDSHLKLRLDFSNDPAEIRRAFFESLLFGPPSPPAPAVVPGPSLARLLDPAECRAAASVDRALELVAGALGAIPGGKALLFFGWGLRVDRGLFRPAEPHPALRALERARVTVFPLDITLADSHTLSVELTDVADRTGGTYESLFHFPEGVLGRIARRLSGHYVLVCVRPGLPRGLHRVEAALAGRPGEVRTRTYTTDP